jgi:uncharacterized membrane protein YgcG
MSTPESTTQQPTVSRTIKCDQGDYTVSVPHNVFNTENGKSFLTFSTTADAANAFTALRAAGVRCYYLSYSLFVKTQSDLTEDSLRAATLALVPAANLTYLRVDTNGHTGKVVVDLLPDYQTLKSGMGGEFRFFHFDPKRVHALRDGSTGFNSLRDNTKPVGTGFNGLRTNSSAGRGAGHSTGGRGAGRSTGGRGASRGGRTNV